MYKNFKFKKRPKFEYPMLMLKKAQNPYVMKHYDQEDIHDVNFQIFKTLYAVQTLLTQNLVKKDPNSYVQME